jgi:hypothetical protein
MCSGTGIFLGIYEGLFEEVGKYETGPLEGLPVLEPQWMLYKCVELDLTQTIICNQPPTYY